MIGLLWVLGSVVTYFMIGFAVAAWDMPHVHQRLTHSGEWTDWEGRARAARGFAYFTMLCWPVRGPYLAMAHLADNHNPVLIARELRRREEEIADREIEIKELERRMKIGQQEAIIPMPKPTLEDLRPYWAREDDSRT